MFRRTVFSAALAGLLGGLLVSGLQAVRVVPLILEAESYERAARTPVPPGGAGEEEGAPSRTALTVLANVLTATGFALLLAAGFALRGGADARRGLLWGIGGFAAFSLAPALGLPPELPGDLAAPLAARQAWWWAAAGGTAAGLALIAFKPGAPWKLLGALLIALPHLAGAPQPPVHGGAAPEALRRAFALAALLTSALFWAALGGLAGFFFKRLEHI